MHAFELSVRQIEFIVVNTFYRKIIIIYSQIGFYFDEF